MPTDPQPPSTSSSTSARTPCDSADEAELVESGERPDLADNRPGASAPSISRRMYSF